MIDSKSRVEELQLKAVEGIITDAEALELGKLTSETVIDPTVNKEPVAPVAEPVAESASTLSLADKILYSKLGIEALRDQPLVSFEVVKACCGLIFGAANFEQIIVKDKDTGNPVALPFYKVYIHAKTTHIVAHEDVLTSRDKNEPKFRIKVEERIGKESLKSYTYVSIVRNRETGKKSITV